MARRRVTRKRQAEAPRVPSWAPGTRRDGRLRASVPAAAPCVRPGSGGSCGGERRGSADPELWKILGRQEPRRLRVVCARDGVSAGCRQRLASRSSDGPSAAHRVGGRRAIGDTASVSQFRIADTFTASLARLTGEEQKAVKTTAFDLQMNPANPGMAFHKLAKARDKRFWSVRVNDDIRLIVHRTPDSLLLCYVDHHDKAYAWAECRKLETHPATGAAQLVEIRERVQEIIRPVPAEPLQASVAKKPLLAHLTDAELLGYGVPAEWLDDVRQATDHSILAIADHLPAEAAEAMLELATGNEPYRPRPAASAAGPFDHPDAWRRFRVVSDVEELARALEYPWERWTVFLHPAQRDLVERHFGGPSRVAGSAGTGKTIVALHRTAHLARAHPDARVLLTTFSEALASALRAKLAILIGTEPRVRERIDVDPLDAVARRLTDVVRRAAEAPPGHRFPLPFLLSEWRDVVDAWQLDSWEAYRDVARLGRKTRLPEKQRQALWAIFERVRAALDQRQLVTQASLYSRLAAH